MKTFKQFLKEDDVKTIEDLAKLIIDNKFENNVRSMLTEKAFLYRGAERKPGDYGQIVRVKTTPRESIYSGHQIGSNLWATFKMPSRQYAKFASAERHNAEKFGNLFLIVPKDGTTIYSLDKDFNFSFGSEIEEFFGYQDSFGEFSRLFWQSINNVCVYSTDQTLGKKCSYLLSMADNNPVKKIDDKLFKMIDAIFKNNLTRDVLDDLNDVMTRIIFKKIASGKSIKDILREFFDACRQHIKSDTHIPAVVDKLDSFSDSEIWWESDTLLLSKAFSGKTMSDRLLEAIDAIKNNSDK